MATGGIAEYTCDRGFELLGPARRVCSQNGTWSPQGIPFCGRFSCYPTPFTQPHPFPFVITMRDAYLWYRCNTIPHHLASCHPHREDRTHALCETVFPTMHTPFLLPLLKGVKFISLHIKISSCQKCILFPLPLATGSENLMVQLPILSCPVS